MAHSCGRLACIHTLIVSGSELSNYKSLFPVPRCVLERGQAHYMKAAETWARVNCGSLCSAATAFDWRCRESEIDSLTFLSITERTVFQSAAECRLLPPSARVSSKLCIPPSAAFCPPSPRCPQLSLLRQTHHGDKHCTSDNCQFTFRWYLASVRHQ